jgi:hypothetical protein
MSVLDIVDLEILVSSSTLSRPNFGTPLALVSKVPSGWGTNMVREFAKLTELTDLGFLVTDAAYKLAAEIKSQKPCPKTFKLAKRALPPTQTLHLTVTDATTGAVYALSVGVDGGPTTDLTYTVPGASTTTTVATAIAALIDALTGPAATSSVAVITVTPETATHLVNIKNWSSNIQLKDVTADPGVATDCASALSADDNWYGLLLDSNSAAESEAAAAWALSNGKLFGHSTSDWGVQDSGTTNDVSSTIKLTTNSQAWGIYNGNELLGYSAAALMARGLAFTPGQATWAFKDLGGVSTDALTPGTQNTLEGKDCNFYVPRWGKPITYPGKLYNGDFIDVTHFLNWLDAEMQIQVFNAITSLPKQPYDNTGLAAIEATIKAVLEAGVRAGGLVPSSYTVTMPALDDIDPITRSNRLVPDIEFTAVLAGAIQKTTIQGLISEG